LLFSGRFLDPSGRAWYGRIVLLRSAAVVLLVGACGPVQYIGTVSQSASSAVAAAKSANAEKYAPYEYTAACEYLHKAREEEGYADHQAAVRFGHKATELADKAKKIALEKAGQPPEPNPAEQPPVTDSENENPLNHVPK
jgi:uncharacterized protein DUF4398